MPTPDDLDDESIPITDLDDDEALEIIMELTGLPEYHASAYLAMAHGDPHPGLVEVTDPDDPGPVP